MYYLLILLLLAGLWKCIFFVVYNLQWRLRTAVTRSIKRLRMMQKPKHLMTLMITKAKRLRMVRKPWHLMTVVSDRWMYHSPSNLEARCIHIHDWYS